MLDCDGQCDPTNSEITEINSSFDLFLFDSTTHHNYFQDISQEDNESRALTQPADQEAFI